MEILKIERKEDYGNGYITVKLSESEVVKIYNAMSEYVKECGGNSDMALCKDLCIAKNITNYGRLNNFALSVVYALSDESEREGITSNKNMFEEGDN